MLNGSKQRSQPGAWAPSWRRRLAADPLFGGARKVAAVLFLLAVSMAWAQAPVPTVSVSSAADLLGTTVKLQASFTNGTQDDDQVGYGPYLDVFLPAGEAHIQFLDATYLGQPLGRQQVSLGADGTAVHPFALDASGQPLQLVGQPGGTVMVLTLPFGSVTRGQPDLSVDVQLAIGPDAAPEQPIDIDIVPGFRYGSDPLNNPETDPQLRGGPATGTVTPELVRFQKRLLAPEGDTPVGESFTHRYELELLLAPGQTLRDVVLTDVLPNALVIRGGSLSVQVNGAAAAYTPAFTVTGNGSNPGTLPVDFPASNTGPFAQSSFGVTLSDPVAALPTAPATVLVGFDFFIPSIDANGAQAGAPIAGNQTLNLGAYQGHWTGNGAVPAGRDLTGQDVARVNIGNDSASHPEQANGTLRLQKWVGSSGNKHETVTPGQTVTYYLDFQVSDVSAFADVTITDVLQDGLEYVPGSMTLDSYVGHGASELSGAIGPANLTVNVDGSSTLSIDLSGHLASLAAGAGNLVGACVLEGFGGLDDNCLTSAHESTRGTISYQARVLNQYRQPVDGESASYVVQNDEIDNTATIEGEILDVVTGQATGQRDSDPGTASVSVAGLGTAKSIAFINGEAVTAPGPIPPVSNGDLVTFRLQADLSALAFKQLVVSDFLPLPVFVAPGAMSFVTCGVDALPGVNQVCYAPDSTFAADIATAGAHGYDPGARTITTDPVANSFTIHFGDYAPASGVTPSSTIVLYATLEVADTALADGLFITNMLQASDFNSASAQSIDQQAVQLQYTRPDLNISNGVIAVGNDSAYSEPDLPGSVEAPLISGSGAGQRGDPDFDLNVSGLDADDIVTVLVIVENFGRGKAGAFDLVLRENLPAGLSIDDVVTDSLSAALGTGAPYALPAGAQADLFSGTGLALPGNVLARGVQENGSVTNDGSNILYLTYQVRLPVSTESGTWFTTISEVVEYAAVADGGNMTAPGLITDDLTVAVTAPSVAKSVSATSEAHTAGDEVTIGEIVRYRLVVNVPEGRTTQLVLTDTLPEGLAYMPAGGARIAAVSQATADLQLHDGAAAWLTPPFAPTAPTLLTGANSAALPAGRLAQDGNALTIDLGTVVNSASTAQVEQLIVEFNALVTNTSANDVVTAGNQRNKENSFTATHGLSGRRRSVTSAPTVVRLVEPRLSAAKSVVPAADIDAGDSLTYTIVISNAAADAVTAFDLSITDSLPQHVDYANHALASQGAVNAAASESGGTITVTADSLEAGGLITLTIDATVAQSIPSGVTVTNQVDYAASSLPGPSGTVPNDTGASTPGATGESDGERQYTGQATIDFTSRALQPTKSVVGTSEAHTSGANVTIGEVVRYRLAVTIPEGVNNDFTLVDVLPAGLRLANPANANLSLIGQDLRVEADLSANVLQAVCAAPLSAPAVPFPAARMDSTGQTISFLLGNISNNTDNDDTDDDLGDEACAVLEFNAVVRDVTGNAAGATLINTLRASANGTDSAPATATVTIVEPALTISKSVDAAAVAGGLDAGDQVTYTLQVEHAAASSADAYDLQVTDQLPAELDPGSLTATIQPGELATAAFNGNLLTVTAPALATGQTFTITVTGSLIAELNPGTVVDNSAALTWTGLPGAGTGAGQPGNTTGSDSGAERGYGPVTDDAQFTTRDLTISKTVQATSEAHTSGNDVVVGEVVRYRLAVDLPEGVSTSLQVLDTLPDGLTAPPGAGVRAALVAGGNHVTAASLAGIQTYSSATLPAVLDADNSIALTTATLSGAGVQIDLGDVTNAAGVAGDEQLILEFNAVVTGAASNAEGATLTNGAQVLSGGSLRASDSATVTVREPQLSVAKAVLTGDSDWSDATGGNLINADIGETVTFQVTLTNAAGAVAAHQINLTDVIPTEFQLVEVRVVPPAGATQDATVTGQLDVTLATLNPGETLTVQYDVLILDSATYGQTITNTADFTAVSTQADNDDNPTGSPSGSPRDYEGDSTATTTMAEPLIGLAKQLTAGPVTVDAGLYTFSFTFVAENLGAIQLDGVQVTDDLTTTFSSTSGVTVTSSTVASVLVGGVATPAAVNADFDGDADTNLLTPDTVSLQPDQRVVIVLDLEVQLGDHQALGTYQNSATATGTTPGGIPAPPANSSNGGDPEGTPATTPVTFTETPAVSLTKEFVTDALVAHHDGSFTVQYRVAATNTGQVPLRSLQVQDDLTAVFGAGSTLGSASVQVQGANPTIVANANYDGLANTDLLDASQSWLGAGTSQSLLLTVTVTPASSGVSYTNRADVTGTSPLGQTATDDATASNTFTTAPQITIGTCVVGVLPSVTLGRFTVTLSVRVQNDGDLQLGNAQALLDLDAIFVDAASYRLESVAQSGGSTVAVNAGYGADPNWNLLPAGTTLFTAQQSGADFAQYDLTLTVVPGNQLSYTIAAAASGQAPIYGATETGTVTDSATNWCDPAELPGPDPSILNFDDEATLGVAKRFVGLQAVPGSPGVFQVEFEFGLRNYGHAQLNDLSLIDDFGAVFADGSVFSVLDVTTTGTLNAAAVPLTGNELLAAGSYLGSQGQASSEGIVTVRLQVTPADPSATYENSATASGTNPDGDPVTDDSVDGDDPDANGNNDPTDDTSPTPFTFETPVIGVAKDAPAQFDFGTQPDGAAVANPHNLGNGDYLVAYELTLRNYGDVPLTDLALTDDLLTQLAVATPVAVTAVDGSLTANAGYDGLAGSNILEAGQELAVGGTANVFVIVTLRPGAALQSGSLDLQNQAAAAGTSPGGQVVTDASNAGTDPDSGQPNGDDPANDGDDDPTNNDGPTGVTLTEAPLLGVAKSVPATFDFGSGAVANPSNLQDGTYEVAYLLTLANYGDVLLTDLQLTDDLETQLAAGNPTAFRAVGGSLTANSAYDGAAASNILADGQSLAVGASGTVYVVVTLQPGAALLSGSLDLQNQAAAQGTSPGLREVTDDSNAGTDPDSGQPNGDDPANDGDDDPTNNDGPTGVTLTQDPQIAIAKTVTDWQNLGTGVYRVQYSFVVQNQGDVNLSQVGISDDFAAIFRGADYQLLSITTAAPLAAAAVADAQASGQLLDPAGSSLLVGASGTVTLVLDVEPRGRIYDGAFLNTALASGTSPSGAQPTDVSNDGTAPDQADDTPTPLELTEEPVLGVAKRATVTPVGDGRFDVQFDFTLTNYGDIELRNLQLTDDLDAAFGAGNHRVLSLYSPRLSANFVAPDPANPAAFDGSANQNLLLGVDTLAVGASATVQLQVRVTPARLGAHQNQATGQATSPGQLPVTDRSTDGLDPDPDGSGVPDEETPTPVTFGESPLIGLAKSADVSMNDDGSFNVTLTFTVRNMGDAPLRGVRISDPLDGIYAITDLTPDRIFVQSSTLTVNPNYDGRGDDQVLLGNDTLAVGAQRQVTVRLQGIRPTSGTSTTNSALASGNSPNGTPTEDRSTDGIEPDPDGDGSPTEQVPTPIDLSSVVQVALAKSSSLTVATDGSYDITFTLTVANVGNTTLHGLQVRDDLAAYYAGTNLTPAQVSVSSSQFRASSNFDGATDARLLLGTDSLAVGASGTIQVTLSGITPTTPGASLANSAVANATGPDGTPTNDRSNDGNTPEAGVDTPTITQLTARPLLGVAKEAAVLQLADGTYSVTFDFVLRNYGNAYLQNVSLIDDLTAFYAGAGLQAANITVTSSDLPVNAAYDGQTDTQLLGLGADLDVGEAARVRLQLSGLRVPAQTTFTNQAQAAGQTETGQGSPPELSTDGPNPDPDANGDPTDDSAPTPVPLAPRPLLGVAKQAAVVQNADGSYRLQFTLRLTNMGSSHLQNLSLVDDLADFYTHTDLTPASVTVTSHDLPVNADFDGQTDTQLLGAGAQLAVGQSAAVLLTLDQVTPLTQTAFQNSAVGAGESPDGAPTTDDSQDGDDPDPNGDGDPTDNDDPTPVVLQPDPRSGLAKRATTVANGDGTFDITFDFVLGNYGNTVLQGLQVRDDLSVLYALTNLAPARIAVTSPDFATNASYDGLTDPRLLAPGNSLAVGARGTITLSLSGITINAPVDTYNTAVSTGRSPDGTPSLPEASTDGSDPDPDGDGDPGNDSEPTPVRLGQAPRIGLAKAASVRRGEDGSYDITFDLLVRNYGDAPLADLSLADDLTAFYAGTNLSPQRVSVSSDDLLVNPTYDGSGTTELLAAGNRLAVGQSATLSIRLTGVVPNGGVTRIDNLALARGAAPDGTKVADTSTDGNDPDPDGSGPQNHSDPTPVRFEAEAAVLLTKEVKEGPYAIGDRVPYTLTIINPNDVAAAFDLTDRLPAGTTFLQDTAAFEPANLAPSQGSQPRQDLPGTLSWHGVVVPAGAQLRVTYELRVLPGAGDTLVNHVELAGLTGFGAPVTAQATAVARVTQGVFDLGKGTLIGRVYFDVDRDDSYRQGVDLPIQGARVLLSNGWQTLTDAQGNYAFRDLESGSWTVMVDRVTAPYAPSAHPEQLRDERQHLVDVRGLTVTDFPFQLPEGLAAAVRETVVTFGPITVHKSHLQLEDGLRVVLLVDFGGAHQEGWPALLIQDPVPGEEPRLFMAEPSATPTVFTYDLPLGTPLTDPETLWSDR